MSESELLLIGISMVLAAGLVKCAIGLYHATISPNRYWMPQVLLWTTFFYGVNFLWAYKDNLAENPSYIFYAASIAGATTFVLRAHIMASNNAELVEDWLEHFNKTARHYFVVSIFTSMLSLVSLWSSRETNGFDTASIPFWFGAGLNAIGAISTKLSVRGTITILQLIMQVVGGYLLFANNLL